MNKAFKVSLLVTSFMLTQLFVSAEQKPVELKAEAGFANVDIIQKDNFIKAKYASAENRFAQGNVKASHDDYSELVSKAKHDDYVFLAYGIKMAEYGFFDLSEDLITKLDNNLYTKNYVKDIRKFYYPSNALKANDIIYLADAYASITYNNLAIETTSELINSVKASNSDYKNYLIALGYYKSNNLSQALKFIENAIIQNDNNINYKVLKAKILADSKKSKQALKVLKDIQKTEFLTVDFQDKIRATEEYVLYKIAKDETLKDYHLAYYYHLQGKSLLATKVLQGAILQAKQHSALIFGLLAKIYYENNEPLKAQEFAQRAYKENKKNYHSVLTLADLAYDERKYEESLGFYKEARSLTKTSEPAIGIAKSYLALEKDKKTKKIYEKLLKTNTQDLDLLVSSLKVFPQKAYEFLPVIASLDITNNEIWLGLADVAIKDKNFVMAETYLNNSYYIDENNFKYYYYLSLVYKAKGDFEKSKQSLIKCSRLNTDYEQNINSGQYVYEK